MSLASGANKWASKAVIVLQLAAWSAVGVVLLQKGIVSLQKLPKASNITQVNTTNRVLESDLSAVRHRHSVNEAIDLSVVPLNELLPKKYGGQGLRDEGVVSKNDLEQKSNESRHDDGKKEATMKELMGINDDDEKAKKMTTELKNERPEGTKTKELADVTSSTVRTNQEDKVQNGSRTNSLVKPDANVEEKVESSTPIDVTKRRNRIWEARKKWKMSHVVGGGGGTAAAIAMVTVGAIMLILGPAVVILRALDEKRQERRFIKLSAQDDLPPTYEQATLMDEAPRYSTLSLNTIFGPPPPPSPVPTAARVRLA